MHSQPLYIWRYIFQNEIIYVLHVNLLIHTPTIRYINDAVYYNLYGNFGGIL